MGALIPLPQLSPDSGPALPEALPLGSITPRLWTRPLRTLTPWTSYGYAVIHFAATVLGKPLDPWQQWLVIHLGELLPDGRPRFRQALVLVARQNGKTHLCIVLSLFWLFVERWPLVFGTSTNLEQAAEPWEAACDMARDTPALAGLLAPGPSAGIRKANGQQTLTTAERCKYKIGAVSPRGGRGKSIDRIIGDELREHRNWVGYNAAFNAMNARPNGQAIYITNQGDDGAVVLNSLRNDALPLVEFTDVHGAVGYAEIVAAGFEPRLGIFEWSAPDGCHPMDPAGWAAANPQLGRRMDYDTIRAPARRVSKPGADLEELAGFRTENLCQSVKSLNSAINMDLWRECLDPAPIGEVRFAACVDVAMDGAHATLAVAAVEGDHTRVEIVASWTDIPTARREVAEWVKRNKPALFGWFPGGPAAMLNADLKDRTKQLVRGWPPRGVKVAEIQGETAAVCMGFAQLVRDKLIRQSGQQLADEHLDNAEKGMVGPAKWVFDRAENGGHIDGAYALAGAVHLARIIPAGLGQARILFPTQR